jgi:hypothetical protein
MKEEILKRIDLLAEKLNVSAEFIFETMVQGIYATNLISVVVLVVLITINIPTLYFVFTRGYRSWSQDLAEKDNPVTICRDCRPYDQAFRRSNNT